VRVAVEGRAARPASVRRLAEHVAQPVHRLPRDLRGRPHRSGVAGAGATWGLGNLWERLPIVNRNTWLR
jgi:hypothetical protein